MSEEEIIKQVNELIRFNEQDENISYSDFELMSNKINYQALKGLLYLYQKEKEKNKILSIQIIENEKLYDKETARLGNLIQELLEERN